MEPFRLILDGESLTLLFLVSLPFVCEVCVLRDSQNCASFFGFYAALLDGILGAFAPLLGLTVISSPW